MGMTYYAVTNDPNELAHFGIKGMKWGVRKEKPRSAAYKKAQSKLGKMMKSGIKKAEAHWKAYNSPKAKEARFMKKAMEQARTGTLKYGKLTDDQVRRVTDRLALERQARNLGSVENPRYAKRLKMAIGEGIIRGIGNGTNAYIEERFRGRGRTTAEIKAEKRKARYEGKDSTQRTRARNKQTEEFYKTAFEEGENPDAFRYGSERSRAKYLSEVKERNRLSEIRKSNQDTYNRAYYTKAGTSMGEYDAKKRQSPVSQFNTSTPKNRLYSGNSNDYPVTQNTYKTPNDSTSVGTYVVDPKGRVRYTNRKRPGR